MIKEPFHNSRKNLIKSIFKAPYRSLLVFLNAALSNNRNFWSSATYLLLALVLFGTTAFVQAQFLNSAYTIKTINVYPSVAEGEGWNNIETLAFQNLDEFSLLQEFNSINSATLNVSKQVQKSLSVPDASAPEAETVTEGSSDLIVEQDEVLDTVDNSVSDSLENDEVAEEVNFSLNSSSSSPVEDADFSDTQTTTTVAGEGSVDLSEVPDVSDDVIETNDIEVDVQVASTTVLRKVESFFALAVAAVTSAFETSTSSDYAEEVPGPQESAETSDSEVVSTPLVLSEVSSSTVLLAEVSTTTDIVDIDTEFVENDDFTSSTSSEGDVADESPVVSEVVTETGSVSEVKSTPDSSVNDCVDDCKIYSLSLSDFSYPLDESVELSGAQLRLSFAALKKTTRQKVPEFTISYSVDGGSVWSTAGSIVIDDEASNAINGGYYLFAIPEVGTQDALDKLEVKLVYQDNPELLKDLFVESVWLELFTLESQEVSPSAKFLAEMNDDGFDNKISSGDELKLPSGEKLEFTFTDDNTDETLIIKSTDKEYVGLTKTTTHFSVTNNSSGADDFSLQAYFPKGVGEVLSIKEFNQNKPKKVVLSEYRPFVYNCEAGWEFSGEPINLDIESLSKQFSLPADVSESVTLESTASSSNSVEESVLEESESVVESPVVEFNLSSSSTLDLESLELEDSLSDTTTTVMFQLSTMSKLLAFSTTTKTLDAVELISKTDELEADIASSSEQVDGVEGEGSEEKFSSYRCRNTNIVRQCDSIDGDNTACRVEDLKVAEHEVTKYAPGWQEQESADGGLPELSFFKKVAEFVGFGPDRKNIPDRFEARSHTPGTYTIDPGETKYFEMEISFPPLSSGEYWIEAVGGSEYGLLDPFWSSEWSYRLPVTLDNTAGTENLTEHQVLINLTSGLTDFWNNVNADGSDVRFVAETTGNENDTWYDSSWNQRVAVTVQSSQVGATLTDYPMYVDLSTLGPAFFSAVKSDGADIRITSDDGVTELPYELVSINTGSDTGELHFKASSISNSVDTTFYIYYDNIGANGYSASDTFGSQNVWTNAYEAVYHLVETSTGAAGEYIDSTNNSNDGTGEGTLPTVTTGKFGSGQDIVTGRIDLGNNMNAAISSATEYTISAWVNLDGSGTDQSIVSQYVGGGDILFWADTGGSGTGFCHYNGSYMPADCANQNDQSVGTWQHVQATHDNIEGNLYADGAETGSGANTTTFGVDAALRFSIGTAHGDDTARQFNGQIDEVRISTVDRGASWIASEFTNQDTPSTFYATSSAEVLSTTSYVELDFWLQYFNSTSSEADVWVQVDDLPAAASTTIYMYYGNVDAVTGSNEMDTFTYSTTTDTYYVVDSVSTGNIVVYSLIDNNIVQLDGGTEIALNAGETTSLSGYTGSSTISVLGPVSLTIDDAGADTVAPVAFATTTFAVPTNRNTSQYFVYSPFASSSVNTYVGNSGTPDESFSVATGTVVTSNTDASGANGVIIESSEPVLVYHKELTRDSFVLYPATTDDLFGIDSNNTQVSAMADNPDPTVYCSDGTSASVTGVTRGEEQGVNDCTQGADGTGDAVRFTGAATPFAAIQQADGDGSETTVFLPQFEFATEYYFPTGSAYAAVACSPRFGTSTIEVQTNGGATVEALTCTPSGELPGKAYFVNGGDGDTLAFSAGYKIVSTNGVPFYVIYEDDSGSDNDETNIWGSVQARKFTASPITAAFGAEEVTIDAEYEQLSYGWFENLDNQTPTDAWSLGEGSYATEGVPITGQGAVNDEDVLRLRMNLMANVATGTASSSAFKLQYSTSETCSLPANSWFDLGAIGSTTALFVGYDNASVSDGSELSSTTLASSTVFATYEEQNLSTRNPNEIGVNEVAEWDWVVQSKNAVVNTNYCFRMVRSGDQELVTYTAYPELYTAGPPLQPTTIIYFDNEATTDLSSVLEFVATDAAGDEVNYHVQIDDDIDFGSPEVDRNSLTNFLEFENVNTPSDKAPFDSGAQVRFTSPTALTSTTTYWWRVRGRDPDGSDTYGDWSDVVSFTTDSTVTVSKWYQTTGDQFTTDTLVNISTSTTDAALSSSPASLTTTAVDFDDATVGNAWGEVSWNDTETSGSILYQIEYLNGSSWTLVPDSEISNNSIGTTASPINILGLDPDVYDQIRVVATLTGATLSIQDITVIWGQRVETPELLDPFDNEKTADLTPTFTFTTTDPQSDDLEYEISYGTDYTFVSSTTINSTSTPADFSNVTTPADVGPFNSGDTISYTVPGGSPLTDNATYWWKVRAKDPDAGNAWSPWSDPDVFTASTSVAVSTWFQTTQEQFEQGTVSGLIASTSDSVEVSSQVGEYGKIVVTNGVWTEITTQVTYNDPVVVASVRYSPTGETQRSPRVRNKTASTFEVLSDNFDSSVTGTTTVDYVVMETGTWTLVDGAAGTQVIAGTFENVNDVQANSYSGSGFGEDVTFLPAFSSPPAVIATVSTENDSSWVHASINDGNTRNNPPTATGMGVYMGRDFESAVHAAEDIDYIAMEPGHGTNNGSEFDADFGNDSHDEPPVTAEAFNSAFSVAPEVVLVMQGAVQGGNGGYAGLYAATVPTATNYYPFIDEDGTGADRNHTPEPVLALSFESASGILLRDSSGGDLSGTIYSEPVLFSDGSGPKFEQLLWNDVEVGTSTAVYQLQYLTSTSSWAFIPDVDLANNSIGTTTSPIDLTGLNVSTYGTLRILATLQCASANCPELNDWTVEWSEGVTMTGTLKQYDRSTNVVAGTVTVSINGGIPTQTGSVSAGAWSINNVTAFDGDILTVFVDGAAEANEAVAVFQYDGLGDITNVNMFEQHLTLTSDELATTTLAELALSDNSVIGDEDVFFDVDVGGDLSVCAVGSCADANLYIDTGNIFIPASSTSQSLTTHDLVNYGTVELDGTTLRVSGSWDNQNSITSDASSVIFTATSTSEAVDDLSGLLAFYDLTFGETSGTATWTTQYPMDVDGDLLVTYGTLARASSTISAAKSIVTGTNGFWTGVSTTTFDGSGAANWSDSNTVLQNIGEVVVDGSVRTVNVASNVKASSIEIAANDTLNGGGSYDIQISGDFTNNNIFVPSTSRLVVTGDSVTSNISVGGSNLYAFLSSTTNGSISFTEATVSLLDDFEIATGTVTLPNTLMQIGGSFTNTSGDFAHNNAEVAFNGAGSETIQLLGTTFLNSFYDVSFTGAGDWTFSDTNATTTNDFDIQSGAVTLPSGQLTVGGIYNTSGSGSFVHNSGEVILLIKDGNTVLANSSDFNNVRIREGGGSGIWYDNDWGYRKAVTIAASAVDGDLVNFPVYVDLADFGSTFFTDVNSDGGDIRVTQSDGVTELAREIVTIDAAFETGELHFNANSISSTTNTTFYVYYGNSLVSDYAITDTYGAENTWNASYEAVYHLSEAGSTYLDSTSNSNDGAGELVDPATTTGRLGIAQDFGADGRIDIGNGMNAGLISAGEYTISAWVNLDTSAFDQAPVGQYVGNGDFMVWADAGDGGTGYCHYNGSYMPSDCRTIDNQNPGSWQHVVSYHDGTGGGIYLDGLELGSGRVTVADSIDASIRFGIGSENGDSAARELDGQLDEVRIVSAYQGIEWAAAEYTNQSTTTDFYSISSSESAFVRTFSEVNTTILGDIVVESGEAVFPTGVLSVGGSFDNDGIFNANGGTVKFDSTAGAETIAAGSSTFATLAFDSATGDFTVTENATATNAVQLTNSDSFTLNSGLVLEAAGTFTNNIGGASTTWTGSTLKLSSGSDYVMNLKTDVGDVYATLLATGDTDVSVWNSSATIYTTQNTSSIYSQDHVATDGDLYIFGDYIRTMGTEHWSYATDFDGVDLAASSSERQANVRVVSGGSVTASSSILSISGSSTASTTIDSQSGTFTLLAQTATVTASYFEMTGTDVDGFNLTSSSTVTLLDNALFTIGAGVSSLTVDATTIDSNPGAQFFDTDFVTGGGSANVTLSGSPVSFWWFRDGVGDRYGEAFDNADGDPGSIRWDDSSYLISVAGAVYADDGASTLGGPTCDGTTQNVRIVVDGGAYASSTSCSGIDGSYSFAAVAYVGNPSIIVYLDTNGGVNGSVLTKTPTASITDLDIYADRVMTRHEDVTALFIVDMVSYDEDDDSDIKFVAATGTPDTLIVRPDTELIVASSTTFTPGGNITLQSNGNGNAFDGSLHLDDNANFIALGTENHLIGGSFFNDLASSFSAASSTVEFTATTSGKGITDANSGTLDFNQLSFTGGGGWNITADITAEADMTISSGTVTGTGDITMNYGSIGGNGILSMGGGTTTLLTSTTLGGTSAWTFYDLLLGDGATTSTTTRSDVATTTVAGQLVIEAAHFLDTGSSVWNLSGTGNVIIENGNILEDTSTFVYSGGAGANVLSTNYYNLSFGAAAGTPTYTFGSLGVLIKNNLNISGSVTSTVDINANDPVVAVLGDITIESNGVLEASASTDLTISGSYDNNGTFNSNAGELVFDSADTYSIAAGLSSLGDVSLSGVGAVTIVENATSTGLFTIASTSDFTQQTGTVLAVGGQLDIQSANTVWIGSTLSLYGGGDYLVNPKTLTEQFDSLVVGSNTDIRLWNTVSTSTVVDVTGSLYSQDHADIAGDLYIYGEYLETTRDDVWSYVTDFDGADLTGGGERQADVYLAAGASALWTGGGLSVLGTSSASTTIQNQGSGTYSLTMGGSSDSEWSYVNVRNIDSNGVTYTASPNLIGFDYVDLLVEINSASAMTLGGTAITASPARTLTGIIINDDIAVTGAVNVTATGTTLSGWRFTSHSGDIAGESFDSDPAGDPGYVIWDDSAAIISISGNVYESDGSTVSSVCDDATTNVVLSIAGSVAQNASSSCSSADGSYDISGVSFGSLDELMLYIDGEVDKGVSVTKDPISSISDMDIYEDHVIVRHENTASIKIADMAIWDSSDDADIPYTAVTGSPDTLTLPANTKLIVWANKEFEPLGDVTLSGGGAGAAYDGTLELLASAIWTGQGTELLSIGGSMISGVGASFVSGNGTTTFTTTGAGRTIDTNENSFYSAAFTGSGSWSVSDASITFAGDVDVTAGALTLPAATSTFGGSLLNSGGSLDANGGLSVFTGTNETVTLGGSDLAEVEFAGGDYSFGDTNATTTETFIVTSGDITLPSGILAVGGDFLNNSGAVTHNTSELVFTNVTSASVLASSSDLYAVTFQGGGAYSFADENLTLLDSLFITNGSATLASGTLSIGGSFDSTGGTFTHATGTILFNSADAGEFIDPGVSDFYNVQISSPAGGYSLLADATTTNNFVLASAGSFTAQTGIVLVVNGVFQNTVAGANTAWLGSTLLLDGSNSYTVNTKLSGDDKYDTLIIGDDSDIRLWNSSATTTTVSSLSSLYSQDHAAVNGDLNIYGDFAVATTSEYWSYATDFDGMALTGGNRRAVTVSLASGATTTVTTAGTLAVLGEAGATSTIQNQGSGSYTFAVNDGSLNMEYYAIRNMDVNGLNLSGSPTITSLSYGDYELSVNAGSLITLEKLTLDSNPSLTILNTRLATSAPATTGTNVNLSATTTNNWTFRNEYGGIAGEDFDIDGATNCDSIRWDDSSCLLTEQTEYRWRYDDGGIDVPDDEWYDTDWSKRSRVRVANNDNSAYTNVATMVTVTYDSDMQADFDDLFFTASDGVTPVDYWIERFTSSVSADVWVKVPSLAADATESLFMYYGNVGTSSAASSTAVFIVVDDFEDNNISEYVGETAKFALDSTSAYGGVYDLELGAADKGTRLVNGIARFGQTGTTSQGETIRYKQYVDTTAGSSDESCVMFGVQAPVTASNNYGVCLELFGTDRISLVKDVESTDTYGGVVQLASSTLTYATGWYEVVIDWQTDNVIDVALYDSADTLVATTSATDSAYTAGGFGFTSWGQNGSWDSFTSRLLLVTQPTTFFGVEQVDGGATYAAAQNTQSPNFLVGDVARLRVAIENTGLDITNQEFALEFAAKGAAPSCAAVSAVTYSAVPVDASCGASAICMATSTSVANGVATSDLLNVSRNTFSAGEFVEDPSNKTSAINVNQNFYTELEYALVVTANAADQSYCFRVTDNGSAYDSYVNVPEITIKFDPVMGAVTFNEGNDIALIPGTTTTVYATGTVTDLNGYSDLSFASSTMYRSGVAGGAACSVDNNDCYISTTASSCSFTSCSGNSCTVECSADIYFHADPTDVGTYSGQEWLAFVEVEDSASGYDFASAIGVELLTLRAIDVAGAINYGALAVNDDTGSFNASTTIANEGNVESNLEITGSDLTDGAASVIPAPQQIFATSTFTYSSCGATCGTLSSTTPVNLDVDLAKPAIDTPPVEDDVYWGIAIPFGVNSVAHQGINVFTPVSP